MRLPPQFISPAMAERDTAYLRVCACVRCAPCTLTTCRSVFVAVMDAAASPPLKSHLH